MTVRNLLKKKKCLWYLSGQKVLLFIKSFLIDLQQIKK